MATARATHYPPTTCSNDFGRGTLEMDGLVCVQAKDLEKIENEVLLNKQQYLVTHVKPDDIFDALIEKKLVGKFADQKYQILTNTVSDKVRIILDELKRSRPGYLKEFCTILKESRTQDHIVDELQKGNINVRIYIIINIILISQPGSTNDQVICYLL